MIVESIKSLSLVGTSPNLVKYCVDCFFPLLFSVLVVLGSSQAASISAWLVDSSERLLSCAQQNMQFRFWKSETETARPRARFLFGLEPKNRRRWPVPVLNHTFQFGFTGSNRTVIESTLHRAKLKERKRRFSSFCFLPPFICFWSKNSFLSYYVDPV